MRVLVTGAGGLVGSNVAAVAARQSWDVLGCYREEPVEIRGVRTVGFEMANRRACVEAALDFEPDVIVHAAGGVALSRFEHDPFIAQLDFVGVEHTLAAAKAVRARYVLVSCDLVHSGYRPPSSYFTESDLPDPVNAYGRAKLAGEEATMRSGLSWLVTRPGEVYGLNVSRPAPSRSSHGALNGRHPWERSGTPLRLVRHLRERAPLRAPASLQRSPIYAWDYAQRVCELIAQDCEGIYNLGGPRSLGRYEWIGLLAREFSCPDGLIREGSKAAYLEACGEDPHLRLPPNTALSDEKARRAIGSPAVAPERGLGLMHEQLRHVLEPVSLQAR